ncbi:MAG: hypothetical protein LBJ46_08315 [Planctomycetota bacterium]|jgi:hypothetical protein|nr:hypothetical protein [Planctomycetota bacterium]
MTGQSLIVQAAEMNRETMSALEGKGLIHRIAPGKDVAGPVDGTNLGRPIYETDGRFGGHKLIVATIGATTLRHFGYHEEGEDVWLLGLDSWRPLYFVFATCLVDEFREKVRAGALAETNLVCLRARYNDPEASFYVVNKHVPHGEFVVPTAEPAPSFYVTESAGLQVLPLAFGSCSVRVRDGDRTLDVTP